MEEGKWQVNGVQAARVKCNTLAKGNSCPVNQCSIVASRGDLARNNRTARETPAPCIVDKRSKTSVNAASTRAKRRDNLPLKRDIPCADDFGKAQRPIRKSFSVPDCLREGKIVPFQPIFASILSSLRHAFRKVLYSFFRIRSSLYHRHCFYF